MRCGAWDERDLRSVFHNYHRAHSLIGKFAFSQVDTVQRSIWEPAEEKSISAITLSYFNLICWSKFYLRYVLSITDGI